MQVHQTKPRLEALLQSCADGHAGLTFYTAENAQPEYLTYREFYAEALDKACFLQHDQRIVVGGITLIHFQTHRDNAVWFWASILAGCVPAMSTPLVNDREGRLAHLRHLRQLLQDPAVITSSALADRDFADGIFPRVVLGNSVLHDAAPQEEPLSKLKGIPDDIQRHPIAGGVDRSFRPRVDSPVRQTDADSTEDPSTSLKDVAALMLTSGSSGSCKAVPLTHEQIITACRGKLSHLPLPDNAVILNWIGLDHVGSLTELHISAMLGQGYHQVHVPAATIIADPFGFLRLLSKHSVARTFAPNFFLHKLLQQLDTTPEHELRDVKLDKLLYLISGGEPNSVDVCKRLSAHLSKLGAPTKNTITPGFGMTETCAGCIYSRECPDVDIDAGTEFAGLGTCVPGVQMRINHAADERSRGAQGGGQLELKGSIVLSRYFNNVEATQEAISSDGWFSTGDKAEIDHNGHLRLVGRSKELIFINGVKYSPQELEGAIERESIPGVASCSVICSADRAVGEETEHVQVVYQRQYDEHDTEARMATLNSIVRTVVLFTGSRPHVLPLSGGRQERSTLGKLSRAKARASFLQGEYGEEIDVDKLMLKSYREQHNAEPTTDAERKLMRLFKDLDLGALDMGVDTPILDVGVSSVDLIRVKTTAQTAFGIADIPVITVISNPTIRTLAAAIAKLQDSSSYTGIYNPVVTIQPNGHKTPLWLIHPGIGEMLVFLGLTPYFADRPVHAMRARGLNPGESCFSGLEEIVTTYHRAVKRKQPHGPYAIAGYSYGSMLAFEITKVLEAGGDRVQFLGSFNLPPHIKARMRRLDWTAGMLHIAHFCSIVTQDVSEQLADELRPLSHEEQVSRLLAVSDTQRCAELALDHAGLQNWTDVSWSLQKIGWGYDPSGVVPHIDVFFCQPLKDVARTREEYRAEHLNLWVNFVRDDVKFWEVEGEHYTMIDQDHVAKFQQTLKKALAARGL